jgi:hypothetical protein
LKWAKLNIDDHQIKNCPSFFEVNILTPFGTEMDLKTTVYGANIAFT